MTQSSTFYKHLEWPKSKIRPEHFSLWSLWSLCFPVFSFSEKTRRWVKSVSNQAAGSLREIHYLCALAPMRLRVLFFQAAGSLREIHYLCALAPLSLCVLFFQAAGSLREIHYLCALAPLSLCVLFFQAAGSLREIHYLCVDFFYLFLVGLFKELLL